MILIIPPLDLLPGLLTGVGITIELTLLAGSLAFVVAFLAGFGRLSGNFFIRNLTKIYVEIFRGTSLLVQLFWFFFVLPIFGLEMSAMLAGVLTLGLHYGAYSSEIVRSSILSMPKGQTEAGIALNMTPWQIMRLIILPQAIVKMLPSFGNNLIELLKGTALVSLITLSDLMFKGVATYSLTLRTAEVFGLVLLVYFVLALPLTFGVRTLEKRLAGGRA